MIGWTIYICFAAVLVLAFIGEGNKRAIRIIALLATIASLLVGISGVFTYRPYSEVITVTKLPWISALGIDYYLAVDGISLVMVLLTGIASIGGILFSWNIEHRTKEFFCFYLTL